MDPLAETPAIALAGPRRSLRRSTIVFGALMVVGLSLLIIAATTAVEVARTARSIDGGTRASATVVNVAARPANPRSNGDGTVTVELTDAATTWRADIKVLQIDRYHEGDVVEVRYASDDPNSIGIVGERTVTPGIPALVVGTFGLLLTAMAAVALRHVRRARRILGQHEWLAVPTTLRSLPFEVGLRQRALRVVIVHDPAHHVAISAEPVGLKRLPDEVAPMAWVAGLGERFFVVAPPGADKIVLVERLRRRRHPEPVVDPRGRRIPS